MRHYAPFELDYALFFHLFTGSLRSGKGWNMQDFQEFPAGPSHLGLIFIVAWMRANTIRQGPLFRKIKLKTR
jgi:hypothetical protein